MAEFAQHLRDLREIRAKFCWPTSEAISVPMGKVVDEVAADGSLRIVLSNDFPNSFNDVALL